MQVSQEGSIRSKMENQMLAVETPSGIPLLEGIAKEVMDNLNSHFLSLVHFNTCRSLHSIEIKEWKDGYFKEILGDSNLEKVTNAVKQFLIPKETEVPRSTSENTPTQYHIVRLQGQEKYHFSGIKCTKFGEYTGDDGKNFCILKSTSYNAFPNRTQEFGYQEISLDPLTPQLIYTLGIGTCIAILVVGVGSDGEAKKAALMHEDYSLPEFSVTNMFNHSFKDELKNFSKINFFLIGGNGGNEFTRERFNIHKSEINGLNEKYNDLINLCLSTDDLDSPNDLFQGNESKVFFSSIESSTYLWILHRDNFKKYSMKVTCVTGPELSYEKLDAYYRENILIK